ncbi:MAG TPA: tetratricopeptide repeat protein [Calditrichia bacterium]|nr:tetratricopeptide repeat protein [Calditrichota bacterium]HQU73595.1 tetratricopeptide repeat protein [Calditrichia bacterium]HQV30386.1 tetratricopeptide repeat protein [Calditrichia bacterium]
MAKSREPEPQPNLPNPEKSVFPIPRAILLVAFLAVAGSILAFALLGSSTGGQTEAGKLYAQAEQLLNSRDYDGAKKLFNKLIGDFPQHPLTISARERLKAIENEYLPREFDALREEFTLKSLLSKAEAAYQKEHFLTPEEDNALGYIGQILAIDPSHQRALELTTLMSAYYQNQGQASFDQRRYQTARDYFENALSLIPENPEVREKIVAVERAMAQEQQSTRSSKGRPSGIASRSTSPPANPPAVSQTIAGDPAPSSQAQLSTDQQGDKGNPALAESAPKPVEAPPGSPAQTGSLNAANQRKNATSISRKPAEQAAEAASPILLMEESQIDGGVKTLVQGPALEVPRSWNFGGFSKVKAEYIVEANGSVSQVKLVVPSKYPRLNDLVIEKVSQFKYRPATFRGKPTRFKTSEEFIFKQ